VTLDAFSLLNGSTTKHSQYCYCHILCRSDSGRVVCLILVKLASESTRTVIPWVMRAFVVFNVRQRISALFEEWFVRCKVTPEEEPYR